MLMTRPKRWRTTRTAVQAAQRPSTTPITITMRRRTYLALIAVTQIPVIMLALDRWLL